MNIKSSLALALLTAGIGSASTLGPLGAAGYDISAYNIVTLSGNFSASVDIGGKIAVYGNLTSTGSPVDGQMFNPYHDTTTYAMVVGGNDTDQTVNIGNNGQSQNVWIHGTVPSFNSPQPNVTSGQPLSASPFNFASATTYLDNLDSSLISLGTVVTPTTNSRGNYYVAPSGSGVFVYNIAYSYLTTGNGNGFEVDIANASTQTVIINVTGAPTGSSTATINDTRVFIAGTEVGNTSNEGVPVLFNFSTAVDNLSGAAAIEGSILAPNAAYSSGSDLSGQLFVASLNGIGEVHDQYFDGTLPITATPEPCTWILCAGMLMLFASYRITSAKRLALRPCKTQSRP